MKLHSAHSEMNDKLSREDASSSNFVQAVESHLELQRRKQQMLKRRDEIRDAYLNSLAFKTMEAML